MLSDVTTYTKSETAVGVSLKLEDKFNSGRRSGQKEEQGKVERTLIEHLSRARSFTYISTFNLHSHPKGGLLSSFYKWQKWSSKRLNIPLSQKTVELGFKLLLSQPCFCSLGDKDLTTLPELPGSRRSQARLHVCIWPLGAQASQLQQTPFRRFRTLSTPALGPWENRVAFEGAPQARQHLYYFTLSLQDHQMRNSWACRFIRVLQVIPSSLPFPR